MFENPDIALAQYKEALALEDNNLQLLDSIARVQLAKPDCAAAALTLQKARELYPFAGERLPVLSPAGREASYDWARQ